MFYLGVYKDQQQAQTCIESLQAFYSDPILSIADGTRNTDYARFCSEKGVTYIEGQRLKLPRFRGQWTERYLKEFLSSDEPFIIKLDPDTRVNRRVDSFPDADVFGPFRHTDSGKHRLDGSAVGYSRAAAEKILASALLRDAEYAKPIYSHHRFAPPLLRKGEELDHTAVSLQDEIMADICRRLSLRVVEWGEASLENNSAAFYHRNKNV